MVADTSMPQDSPCPLMPQQRATHMSKDNPKIPQKILAQGPYALARWMKDHALRKAHAKISLTAHITPEGDLIWVLPADQTYQLGLPHMTYHIDKVRWLIP